jgi:hypothetical protein
MTPSHLLSFYVEPVTYTENATLSFRFVEGSFEPPLNRRLIMRGQFRALRRDF